MASGLQAQIPPPNRQRPPTSDPSTTTASIELPELSPPPERGRALSSTSSVISNTLGPSILTQSPPHITSDWPSSATESDRSVTPPSTASLSSTPATSLHPSFSSHDRERPASQGERTRNDEPVERTLTPSNDEENNTNGRLTPIPQGALPPDPGSSPTQPPPQDPSSSTTATPFISGTLNHLASLSTLRRSISRTSPLQTSIALAALIVTFIATVYYGHRSDKMNLYMMLLGYRQDCSNQRDAGNLSPECEAELGRGTERPPYGYAYRKVKRGMEVVGGWMRGTGGREIVEEFRARSGSSAYLPLLLIALLVATALIFVLFRRRHTPFQRHPQQGPDLVRNVPHFMILKEPKSGQNIGLTQRRTKNTATQSITLSTRKKSLQDHFDDLHNNPKWKQHLEDFATDDEGEHHGEFPGERIARITRTIKSNSDLDTDTETGSDVEGDSASVMSKFKRNIREKLRRGDTADSTLSALGTLETIEPATRKPKAQPKEDTNPNPDSNANSNQKDNTKSNSDSDPDSDAVPGYNFRIKKGITSMGLVSIGTTLGASAGGEIGREMLVKGVDASELGDAKGDLMVPGEPQDISLVLNAVG